MKVILSCSLLLSSCCLQAYSDPTLPERVFTGALEAEERVVQVELKLSLIRSERNQPVARINGVMLRQGDKIEGWELVTIAPAWVLLRQGAEQKTLRLFKTIKN